MEQRRLGKSSLSVAPLAFGASVFGWTVDESRSFELLDAFVDAGFDLIDTSNNSSAWVHGGIGGQSETIIGKWLSRTGKRDRVVLATKVGGDMGTEGRGLSKRHIIKEVEASLKRLRTDRIDLYQAHFDDEATPQSEVLDTFSELIAQGKVRAIGASNFSTARLRSARRTSERAGLDRYETFQPWYNLYDRENFEREFQQLCLDEGISIIPYFALANGFLTGKYRSQSETATSARRELLQPYFTPRGMRILNELDRVAVDLGVTPAQIALAWLMARPGVAAPIASATSLAQLRELIGAAYVHPDAGVIADLNAASAIQEPKMARSMMW